MKKDKAPFALKFIRWAFPKIESIAPAVAHRFFVKLFFTPLNFKTPPNEEEIRQRADKFTITISGNKKIQCYAWGHGPVVACVHGWAGRGTQFIKFIEPFNKAGYRIVAFDGPAHGQSEGRTTHLLEFKETLFHLYESIGGIIAIIGHSFGGSAGLYSIRHQLPVKIIVCISNPAIADDIINTYLRKLRASHAAGVFFKEYILRHYGIPFEEFTSLHFIKHVPSDLAVLLVHDKDDKEVNVRNPQKLKELFPAASLYITEGLGHTRILKDEIVVDQCVTFIQHHTSILSK